MAHLTNNNDLPALPSFALTPRPPLLAPIPDKILILLLPIAAYWIFSLFFHYLDTHDYLPQYRLHTPAEVLKRNRVSRGEVVRDVIIQQLIQTIMGIVLSVTEPDDVYGSEDHDVAVWAQRLRLAQRAVPDLLSLVGIDSMALAQKFGSYPQLAGVLLGGRYSTSLHAAQPGTKADMFVPAFAPWELMVAQALYWLVVPALQFALAGFIVDTWQYFLHRAMHMNQWLYRTFHSRHHRLYVPYAFGALYNHPFEGFLLDTLGAAIAYKVAGMSTRQGMCFFTGSTIKTVDDHCGYALPWDPLQHITSNNAGYHDIHHQSWGIKTNFSQPFFTVWDRWLGTSWTGGDVSARYERTRIAAEKQTSEEQAAQSATVNPGEMSAAEDTVSGQIPFAKATRQVIESREQVLQDLKYGGPDVLVEEVQEEKEAERLLTRMARKRAITSPSQAGSLKSLKDIVNGSLQGRGGTMLNLESSR